MCNTEKKQTIYTRSLHAYFIRLNLSTRQYDINCMHTSGNYYDQRLTYMYAKFVWLKRHSAKYLQHQSEEWVQEAQASVHVCVPYLVSNGMAMISTTQNSNCIHIIMYMEFRTNITKKNHAKKTFLICVVNEVHAFFPATRQHFCTYMYWSFTILSLVCYKSKHARYDSVLQMYYYNTRQRLVPESGDLHVVVHKAPWIL